MSEKKGKKAVNAAIKDETVKDAVQIQEDEQKESVVVEQSDAGEIVDAAESTVAEETNVEQDSIIAEESIVVEQEAETIVEETITDTNATDAAIVDAIEAEVLTENSAPNSDAGDTIEKASVSVAVEPKEDAAEVVEEAPGEGAVSVSENIEELGAEQNPTEGAETVVSSNEESAQGEESVPVEEVTTTVEASNAEGELFAHEKDKIKVEKAEEKKKKEPSKFGLFVKKHKLIFIIAAIVLLVAAGLTATYFIVTKDMVFIRTAEDLLEADKGNLLVFKANVTVDGDISLEGYSFDMNKYTLTVTGTLTIAGKDGQVINIGEKKRKEFIAGGAVRGDTIIVNGATASVIIRSSLSVDTMNINTLGVELYGDISAYSLQNATININSATFAKVYSAVIGAFALGANVDMDYYGSSNSITGGKTITVYDGASSGLIADAQKVILYPESAVDTINNVPDCVFVEYLAAPELLIIKEGNSFVCYISKVQNADFYDYSIAGQTGRIDATQSSFVLPMLSPAKYDLLVTAGATNESYNSARATAVVSVHYTVKLAKPAISVEESGGVVTLTIGGVEHATEYIYCINGIEYSPVNAGSVIITDKVQGVGNYTVYVYARNTEDNSYEQSDSAMTSYIHKINLAMSEVIVVDNGNGTYTASWAAVANINYYMITEDGVVTYTRATTYTFTESSIMIVAKGTGYYVDSAATIVNAPAPQVGE
ncbi:MAG: hypothetical protein EOM87_05055 [Clostridia bacterium]|nr:hypothetical protein [Clostridia bacterium]